MGFVFAAVVPAMRAFGLYRLAVLSLVVTSCLYAGGMKVDWARATPLMSATNDEDADTLAKRRLADALRSGASANATAQNFGESSVAASQSEANNDKGIPFYDANRYCRYPLNNFATAQCIRSEQVAYDALEIEWGELESAARQEALEAFKKYRTTRYSGAEGIVRLLLEKQRYFEGMRQAPPSFQR